MATTAPTPAAAKAPSYRWPTWVALLLLIAYSLYLYKQYMDLHQLNQHELALEVRELELTVRNALDTVNKAVDICRFDADQPFLDLESPGGCKYGAGDKVDKEAKLQVDGGLTIVTRVSNNTEAKFRVRLDRILAELAFPESFRLVFLAKADGRILYQEAPGSRRWRRKLSWHEDTFREPAPGETEGVRVTDLAKLLGKDAKPAFEQLTAAGSRINLSLGGQSEEIYLQPASIAQEGIILGGVVSRAELIRRALQVETYSVTLLIFLFFLGVFGAPFIKLYSLDKHERFRLRDVCLLYLSSGALLALGVFSVLALDGYSRFGSEADRGLQAMNEELSARFAKESAQAVKQLAHFDESAIRNNRLPGCGETKPPYLQWFREHATPPIEAPRFPVYAEQVAWAGGSGGMQLFKVSADSAGENVSVNGRNYFQAVRQGSLYQGAEGPEFFAGPSRSITDGKFYTFFSIRSQAPPRVCQDSQAGQPYVVAVLTTHLMSLDRQPLPAGYGFALINREGGVLYHSDRRLSLRENLFAELSDSAELKSLVLAGSPGRLSTSYRERPHRFFVSPFEGYRPAGPPQAAHLLFVTFRDTSAEVATVAYVFLESVVLLLVLVLVWAGAIVVVDQVSRFHVDGRRGGTWLWPQKSLDRFYGLQCALLGALVGLAAVLAVIQKEWAEILVLAGPLFAVLIGIVNHFLTYEGGKARARSEAGWRRSIQWALLAFWIAFAPAAVIFRLSLAHEFGKLVETERVWIDQQRIDVAKAVRKEAREDEYPEAVGQRIADLRRLHYQISPPGPFRKPAPAIGTEAKRAAIEWTERLGELLPIHTETGVRLRAREFDASYSPPVWMRWWALLLLGALFAATVWWIQWNANNLFLAGFDTPKAALPDNQADNTASWRMRWDALPAGQQSLLLQVTRHHLANPKNIAAVKELLNAGYLRLNPDIEPATKTFGAFLDEQARDQTQQARLDEWELVNVQRSWHYVRRLLIAALAFIALFLVATQPGLQSGLSAGFGVATTVLVAMSKLRDALLDLVASRREGGAPASK